MEAAGMLNDWSFVRMIRGVYMAHARLMIVGLLTLLMCLSDLTSGAERVTSVM